MKEMIKLNLNSGEEKLLPEPLPEQWRDKSPEEIERYQKEIEIAQEGRRSILNEWLVMPAKELYEQLKNKAQENPRKTSLILDFSPGINVIKIAIEAATGKNLINQEKLSPLKRTIYIIEESAILFGVLYFLDLYVTGKTDPALGAAAVAAKLVSVVSGISAHVPADKVVEICSRLLSLAADRVEQSRELFIAISSQIPILVDKFFPLDNKILELKLTEIIKTPND